MERLEADTLGRWARLRAGGATVPLADAVECRDAVAPTDNQLVPLTYHDWALLSRLPPHDTALCAAVVPLLGRKLANASECFRERVLRPFHAAQHAAPGEQLERCRCRGKRAGEPRVQKLLTCAACKAVRYCSVECQKADRKLHRDWCKMVAENLKAQSHA